MGRILFFLLLALAIYVGWRWWRLQQARRARQSDASPREVEPMVGCAVCGLHLPRSDALPAADGDARRWYCCEAHRRQGEAGG